MLAVTQGLLGFINFDLLSSDVLLISVQEVVVIDHLLQVLYRGTMYGKGPRKVLMIFCIKGRTAECLDLVIAIASRDQSDGSRQALVFYFSRGERWKRSLQKWLCCWQLSS